MIFTREKRMLGRILSAPIFLSVILGALSACSPTVLPAEPIGSAAAVQNSEVAAADGVPPTATFPSIPVQTLNEDSAYPAGQSAYPAAASGALPAPVVIESVSEPAKPTAVATVILPTSTPAPTVTAEPSPTVEATFTPPALPQTSAEDHYWFRRPIPDGGVVWTDKHYPYGGTRNRSLPTHHGVEFYVTYDTPVLAVADGTVIFAGSDAGQAIGPQPDFYGIAVIIEHDFRFEGKPVYTLYGHLNGVTVTVGQRVTGQDVIGLSGATGVAEGPHLHFEVRVGENSYSATRNPLLWLWPFPERGTIVGRVVFPNGELALEAPVSISRIDGGERTVISTTSYADNGVNGDENYDENFAFDDVPAGYYEVFVKVGAQKFEAEVWVFSRRTSFVEIVVPSP